MALRGEGKKEMAARAGGKRRRTPARTGAPAWRMWSAQERDETDSPGAIREQTQTTASGYGMSRASAKDAGKGDGARCRAVSSGHAGRGQAGGAGKAKMSATAQEQRQTLRAERSMKAAGSPWAWVPRMGRQRREGRCAVWPEGVPV